MEQSDCNDITNHQTHLRKLVGKRRRWTRGHIVLRKIGRQMTHWLITGVGCWHWRWLRHRLLARFAGWHRSWLDGRWQGQSSKLFTGFSCCLQRFAHTTVFICRQPIFSVLSKVLACLRVIFICFVKFTSITILVAVTRRVCA